MVPIRENFLATNNFYHIYTRSISKYTVFNDDLEFNRMVELINLCRFKDFHHKYSIFKGLEISTQFAILEGMKRKNNAIVEIIAFCLMPTHIHFLLKQVQDDGIMQFMRKVLNSYSKFFNICHRRSGPLWTGRFNDVPVKNDEQLLHLTRYIHLNPTSVGLVKKPQDWEFSSYREYIGESSAKNRICETRNLFEMKSQEYKKFANDQKGYQRKLSLIKSLLIDNYTG